MWVNDQASTRNFKKDIELNRENKNERRTDGDLNDKWTFAVNESGHRENIIIEKRR
jgi:hypothetical protein